MVCTPEAGFTLSFLATSAGVPNLLKFSISQGRDSRSTSSSGLTAKSYPDSMSITSLRSWEDLGVFEASLPADSSFALATLPPASRNRRAALSTRTAFFQLSLFRLDWDADLDLNSGPDVVPGSSARPTS